MRAISVDEVPLKTTVDLSTSLANGSRTSSTSNEVDKGGHFAAWEQPELFAAEVRAAFRSLR